MPSEPWINIPLIRLVSKSVTGVEGIEDVKCVKLSNVSRLSVSLESYVPWKSSSIEDCHALSFFRVAKELTHEVSTHDSTKSPSSKDQVT